MRYFAIGDLHLSFGMQKPMDIFGEHWHNHTQKIETDWRAQVTEEDVVLIPGDISWAMHLPEAEPDLKWLEQLPGTKVLLTGNHDYWWSSTSQAERAHPGLVFLKNTAWMNGKLAVCGARGWLNPLDPRFQKTDARIYQREKIRLRLSLDAAMRMGAAEIIVMMHFPPCNEQQQPSDFLDIFQAYPIHDVVYGHLHGASSFSAAPPNIVDGVRFHLVSADYLNFQLLQIRV